MENENLESRICSLNDIDLRKLLSLKDLYQNEAVKIAIQEAIKRGIIVSEDDLNLPEFNSAKKTIKSIFPKLNNELQLKKVFSSIVRILLIISIFPILLGSLKLVEHQTQYGFGLLMFGVAWLSLNLYLQKSRNHQVPIGLIVIFLLGISFVFFNQVRFYSFQIIDLVIWGLCIFVILYLLVYLKVLLSSKEN